MSPTEREDDRPLPPLRDRDAFDREVAPLTSYVAAVLRRETGPELADATDFDDLLQETWLRAYRSIAEFRGSRQVELRAWLGTIARRVVVDAARAGKRGARAREVPLDAGGVSDDASASDARGLAQSGPTPSRAMRRGERRDRLDAALRELSPEHRQVIEWVRLEGMSVSDAARKLGRSPNATSMLLLRALLQLKTKFGDTESLHLPDTLGDEANEETPS